MSEEFLGSVDLLLVGGGNRHFSFAPAAIEVGAVRLGGWQVHPVVPPVDRFPGRAAYLVKVTFDLRLVPGVPVPPWVEVGFAFDGEDTAVVMDAVPRTSDKRAPARSYRVDRDLAFVEAAGPGAETAHLPEVASTVVVYGIHNREVRWRHNGPRPGSHTAWFVLSTAVGVTSIAVAASARYDLPPAECFGHRPATRPQVFHVDLVPDPATSVVRTVEARQPVTKTEQSPRVFISYAHDDSEHVDKVLAFANFLVRDAGIDVIMDRWDLEVSRDWYVWAMQGLKLADFVLVIASPLCKSVGEGDVNDIDNRGLQSEMGLLREGLHKERSIKREKYLPVVLPGRSFEEFPEFLQPTTVDHFTVDSFTLAGADSLLQTLRRQPALVRPDPPLG